MAYNHINTYYMGRQFDRLRCINRTKHQSQMVVYSDNNMAHKRLIGAYISESNIFILIIYHKFQPSGIYATGLCAQ
jgi:hypothetical protein